MWHYVPSVATVILAVLQLAKDWGAHQTTWRRATVLFVILLLGVGGAVNTYYSDRNATRQHGEDQKQIGRLQTAVDAANTAQENNTKQFLRSFGELSQKLSNLQLQVKTAGLQKEAAKLKAELEATQKALTPPKAELETTLGVVMDTLENLGLKELAVQRASDGTVAFTVLVVNKSAVQAKNGSVYLRVCELCSFSEEPQRFVKPIGAESYDRVMDFQALAAMEAIAVPLKIKPPEFQHRFEVAITVRCENCMVRPKELLHVDY